MLQRSSFAGLLLSLYAVGTHASQCGQLPPTRSSNGGLIDPVTGQAVGKISIINNCAFDFLLLEVPAANALNISASSTTITAGSSSWSQRYVDLGNGDAGGWSHKAHSARNWTRECWFSDNTTAMSALELQLEYTVGWTDPGNCSLGKSVWWDSSVVPPGDKCRTPDHSRGCHNFYAISPNCPQAGLPNFSYEYDTDDVANIAIPYQCDIEVTFCPASDWGFGSRISQDTPVYMQDASGWNGHVSHYADDYSSAIPTSTVSGEFVTSTATRNGHTEKVIEIVTDYLVIKTMIETTVTLGVPSSTPTSLPSSVNSLSSPTSKAVVPSSSALSHARKRHLHQGHHI